MHLEKQFRDALDYLNSNQALEDIARDPYWPKWSSPWWHMLLLHEMGATIKIPEGVIQAFVVRLNQMPLKIFPVLPEEMPAGLDPYRETMCHCQLGNVYQVLAAWGVDVDQELPWIRPWFLRYQMADGGMNCDNNAYLVKDEVPSSMVGTIAAFEAILLYTPRAWTADEKMFLDKGASFLISRELTKGSDTEYNAEERESAPKWKQLCFPRFYFYDVLRGLNALLLWSEKTKQPLPSSAYQTVVDLLSKEFPDDQIRIRRHFFEGTNTLVAYTNGDWLPRKPATFFPLLFATSTIGEISPYLTKQWLACKARLTRNA